MYDDLQGNPRAWSFRSFLLIALCAAALVGFGYYLSYHSEEKKREDTGKTNSDIIADVVLKEKNRLEVQTVSGKITTVRDVSGGLFGMFDGRLIIRQPFSVAYHVDMNDLTLSDYIWNERARTLIVRLPPVRPDAPNIDESRQITVSKGWVITREMQDKLRQAIAIGAIAQARTEAAKPENMEAARRNARIAIARNFGAPLRAVGLSDVHIEVIDDNRGGGEHWDVSRSIAQVLAGEVK